MSLDFTSHIAPTELRVFTYMRGYKHFAPLGLGRSVGIG